MTFTPLPQFDHDVLPMADKEPLTKFQLIKKLICHEFGITNDQLCGPRQFKQYVWPRQAVYFLASRHGRYTLAEIGRRLGGRDHTTVRYGVMMCEERMRRFAYYRAKIQAVETRL